VKPKNSNTLQQEKHELRKILLSFKSTFVVIAGFSFVINMLMLVPSIYMLQIYDRVLSSRNKETLLMVTLITVFMFVMLAALEWVRSNVMIRAGNKMDEMLSNRTFGVAFDNALKVGTGSATQTFNDLTGIRQFLTGNGLFAFFDAPWVPIYLLVIYALHPALGMLATFSAIVLIIMTVITEFVSKRPLVEANKSYSKATTFASINFRNAEAIDAMGMLGNVRKHWFPKHREFINYQSMASERSSTISSITRFVRITSQSMVYGVGAYYVINMELTPGAMIAGAILMGRALAPVEMVMGSWKGFVAARNSYDKLSKLFEENPENETKMSLPQPEGEVVASSLHVSPPGTQLRILNNVSFTANKGDLIAVIGASASGKSTLARVLVGVWPAVIGDVRLDGADVATWNKDEMGKYIGYLPQNIELLDGTVAENIARFGDVDSDKVVDAAKKAGVHQMILGFSEGYDTFIGEGGSVLSGGQKQRIALARAIYDEPVMVVLDEPNSNLDEAGEASLVETLRRLKLLGKTVFVVTHKKNILSIVDKILVMNSGTVQAYGSRNEILNAMAQAAQQNSAKQS